MSVAQSYRDRRGRHDRSRGVLISIGCAIALIIIGTAAGLVWWRNRALALHRAAASGDALLVARLAKEQPEKLNLLASLGWGFDIWVLSPLMFASARGHAETAMALLEAGADVNLRDSFGRTALVHACESGDRETIELLIRKGANPNTVERNGEFPLLVAARISETWLLSTLLKAGATANGPPGTRAAPLSEAVTRGNVDAVRQLLEHGADIDRRLGNGISLIEFSASSGANEHRRILELLKAAAAKEQAPASP